MKQHYGKREKDSAWKKKKNYGTNEVILLKNIIRNTQNIVGTSNVQKEVPLFMKCKYKYMSDRILWD